MKKVGRNQFVKLKKKWPASFYGEVISSLKNHFPSLVVISFGGEADKKDVDTVHKYSGDLKCLSGVGRWTIRQSLAVLRECDLVLSGDTGIMHMAAAVGTKTISIFGPTSPKRLAPNYNEGVSICPDKPCHPCFRDRYTDCFCIESVRPDKVIDVILVCFEKWGHSYDTLSVEK